MSMAPNADKPGTSEVNMVERTGPKARIISVKLIPEITTEPTPWNAACHSTSVHGAVHKWVDNTPNAHNNIYAGTKPKNAKQVMAVVANTGSSW